MHLAVRLYTRPSVWSSGLTWAVSEVLALRAGHVAMSVRNGEVIVRMGKKGNYRRVPRTPPVRAAFRPYLATLYPPPAGDELTWREQRGTLSTPSSVFKLLRNHARRPVG